MSDHEAEARMVDEKIRRVASYVMINRKAGCGSTDPEECLWEGCSWHIARNLLSFDLLAFAERVRAEAQGRVEHEEALRKQEWADLTAMIAARDEHVAEAEAEVARLKAELEERRMCVQCGELPLGINDDACWACYGLKRDIAEAASEEVGRLRAQLSEAQAEKDRCWTCGGQDDPACACGGTGSHANEVQYMRERCLSLDTRLSEAQQRSEIEGALGVWRTVASYIDSGVPIDGLRSMAGYNIGGLSALPSRQEPE